MLPKDGLIVACADEPHAYALATEARKQRRVITYGMSADAKWRAQNIKYGKQTTFNLVHEGKKIISLETKLLGAHNVQNIVGVSALLLGRGLLSPLELRSGVARFGGLKRRLDSKTQKSALPVYEGFGSSYEKARAAISAMRTHFPKRRLLVVFEPHTFSWRNKNMLHWYDDVFAGAYKVFVYKPADQGAATHEQATHEEIINRIARSATVVGAESAAALLKMLEQELRPSDAILLLTSGELGGLIESIPRLVEQKFPVREQDV